MVATLLVAAGVMGLRPTPGFARGQRPGTASPGRVEILAAVAGLAPDVVGQFRDPTGFERVASGRYLVFDRRGHAVYAVDAAGRSSEKIVQIGGEDGRVLDPSAFDAAPDGSFVVADAPNGRERVQVFDAAGRRMGGFVLPGKATTRVTLGSVTLSGTGTIAFTGHSVVMSQPESGWLITEYGLLGTPLRTVGQLRDTGHESDHALHVALNAGIPIPEADGGFTFVFLAGVPTFRTYDARGTLLFERAIQGREIDPIVAALPQQWPRRPSGEAPLVSPTVRTATRDGAGLLWVSLVVPFTYVYDEAGEKIRTVQFRGAGLIAPSSLSVSQGRLLVTPGCFEFVPG